MAIEDELNKQVNKVVQTRNIDEATHALYRAKSFGKQLIADHLYQDENLKPGSEAGWYALGGYYEGVYQLTGVTPNWGVAAFYHAEVVAKNSRDNVMQIKAKFSRLANENGLFYRFNRNEFKDVWQRIREIAATTEEKDVLDAQYLWTLKKWGKMEGMMAGLKELGKDMPEMLDFVRKQLIVPWWLTEQRRRQYRKMIGDKPPGHEFALTFKPVFLPIDT